MLESKATDYKMNNFCVVGNQITCLKVKPQITKEMEMGLKY